MHLHECTAASKHQEGPPAIPGAAQADSRFELLFALSDACVVEGQLFPGADVAQCIYSNGQTAPTSHHHCLAVGCAAVTHAACKCTLHQSHLK